MLNRIVLVGRLTRDPELRYTPSAKAVASFTLAVDRRRNQQGEKETDFIDIVTWGRLAETCSNYLSKGRLVAVEGRLQIRSYQTQDGQKRKVAEVVADGVHFLSAPSRAEAEALETASLEEDEFVDPAGVSGGPPASGEPDIHEESDSEPEPETGGKSAGEKPTPKSGRR
ncbi:MAG TPA: single-stranded DNA-binding protein [Firmicutes bacterium]|nr:single-stranded DNA-binding protein [Candidatus Fermentithermobacillaceae bacterium]